MRLFFAGAENARSHALLVKAGVRNFLVSYYGLKNKPISDLNGNIFLDSGGFSARIKGAVISVDEYGKYILKNGYNLNSNLVYANLDQKETKDTLENQKKLEEMGLKPIPVYHFSEYGSGNKQLLLDYLSNHDYIAIGGVAATNLSKAQVKSYLSFVFKETKANKKVHGFGMSSFVLLKDYPFYSVDSTTWLSANMFRNYVYFENGTTKRVGKQRKERSVEKFNSFVQSNDEILLTSVKHTLRVEEYITRLWQARGVNWNN
jgi:hypothetical protein